MLQERLLAPRVLHFGRKQLFWECNELCACEMYPNGLHPGVNQRDTQRILKGKKLVEEYQQVASNCEEKKVETENVRIWCRIVEAYTQASLTVTSDKLPALSGIAKYFRPIFSGTYLAGIWRDHIQINLAWYCLNEDLLLPRPEQYRAPTWSWASTENPVTIERQYAGPILRVLDAETIPATHDPTGPVFSGFLLVEGPLNHITVCRGSVYLNSTKLEDTRIYFDEPQDYLQSETSIAGFSLPLEKCERMGVAGGAWYNEEELIPCFNFLFLKISSMHPRHYVRLGLGHSRQSSKDSLQLMQVKNAHDAPCEEFLGQERGHRLKII